MHSVRPFLVVLVLSVIAPYTARALEPQIQFGSVSHDPVTGVGFARSVVLPWASDRVHLDTDTPALRLEEIDASRTRLLLDGQEAGPVSGVLTVDAQPSLRAVVVGEIVVAPRAQWPAVLVRMRGTGDELDHALRTVGLPPARAVRFVDHAIAFGGPVGGWQTIPSPSHVPGTERRGTIVLEDGSELALQASALEAVTVLGRVQLAEQFAWTRVVSLRERLHEGRSRARIAVAGRTGQSRLIRVFDVRQQEGVAGFEPIGEHEFTLGARRARLLPLRVPAGEIRVRRLLSLSGDRARLIDPIDGVLDVRASEGLVFTGAAARSGLRANGVFALRRDLDSGELFLRNWSVGREGRLSARLLRPSISELLGGRRLRALDAVASIDASGWPQQSLRERILLLGRAETRPRLWSIRADAVAGRVLRLRPRWTGELQLPEQGPPAQVRRLASPLAGADGFPVRVRLLLPAVRAVRMLERQEPGARFIPVSGARLNSVHARTDGFALSPRRFLRLDRDENGGLRFARYASTPNGLFLRAGATIEGETTPVALRASRRLRHAWLLTGEPGARYLRLADVGLRAGTNLPPRVDVGADLRRRATSSSGARVSLRARLRDANGDPLALRWSAPDVRFDDPGARRVRALFPVGSTAVRLRARESTSGKAGGPYESRDYLTVTVTPATDAPTVGLRTAIAGVFPNPANPKSRVAFSLARGGTVELDVIDARGRHVRTLLREHRNAGAWDVVWDGLDDGGREVASGVYHVRLRADGRLDTARVTLVK